MLEPTWRWYGPKDRITLQQIRQAGATGIVTALHHIPNGAIWSIREIQARKKMVEDAGLRWSVVESVPVHEDIKKQTGDYERLIGNYKQTIKNLGECRINTICYNFMPLLDWTRTDLSYKFPDGSLALKYDHAMLAAFDLFILKRSGAKNDYTEKEISQAEELFKTLDENEVKRLTYTIIKGLPGSEETYSLEELRAALNAYRDINDEKLRSHLQYFLKQIIPVAVAAGVRMGIHPDDPPWSLFGLPRVVSTETDLKEILSVNDAPENGFTLCTGSLGAGHFNDVPSMAREFSSRINFVHLRNVTRDENKNFMEHYVLEGDVDIYEVVKAVVLEEESRKQQKIPDWQIPFRPDHGNQMLDDLGKENYPGYSLYGRMKGLAEIKGLELGVRKSLGLE